MISFKPLVFAASLGAFACVADARPPYFALNVQHFDYEGLDAFQGALGPTSGVLVYTVLTETGSPPLEYYLVHTSTNESIPGELPGQAIWAGTLSRKFSYEAPAQPPGDAFVFEFRTPTLRFCRRILAMGLPIAQWVHDTIPIPAPVTDTSNPVIGRDGAVRMLGRDPSGAVVLLEAPVGAPGFSVTQTGLLLPGLVIDELSIDERETTTGLDVDYIVFRTTNPAGEQGIIAMDLPSGVAAPNLAGPFAPGGVASIATERGSGRVFIMDNSTNPSRLCTLIQDEDLSWQGNCAIASLDWTYSGTAVQGAECAAPASECQVWCFSAGGSVGAPRGNRALRGAPGPAPQKTISVFPFFERAVELETPKVGNSLAGLEIVDMLWNEHAVNDNGDLAFVASHPDGSARFYIMPSIRTSCPGDSDGSFTVDFSDIVRTLGAWGTAAPPGSFPPPGDADFDLQVRFSDVVTILANFGNDCR